MRGGFNGGAKTAWRPDFFAHETGGIDLTSFMLMTYDYFFELLLRSRSAWGWVDAIIITRPLSDQVSVGRVDGEPAGVAGAMNG